MASEKRKSGILQSLISLFGGPKGSSPKVSPAVNHADRIRFMYERFREILSLNDSTLQLIADIEDRLSGRKSFSMNMIGQRIRQAEMDVFIMIKNLDQLRPGHYVQLYDSLRKIRAEIESGLSTSRELPSGPLVIPLSKLNSSFCDSVGNKMANLGEIRNVLGLAVPDGFAVTTRAFIRFMSQDDLMSQGDIWQRAEKLDGVLEEYGSRVVEEACREVQQAIIGAPMPPDLEQMILKAYDELDSSGNCLVAVRSSAVGEDKEASHAGQFQTELNVSRKWLLDAYRWVLASAFGLSPVMYRLKHGLSSSDAYMAVGCLEMIEPRSSGIAFSRSFADLIADKVEISVTRGLSDAGSGVAVNPEEIIISPSDSTSARSSILKDGELAQLVAVSRQLEKHFGAPQDIEWAIDQSGKLYILQCRPMTASTSVSLERRPAIAVDKEPILGGGFSACPGFGAGPVFQIRNDADLAAFPDNGVLVSPHSSPKYSQVMNRCSAIVTERGSPIGHMSILAREYGVPTIVGLHGATEQLRNGRFITVDAASRRIYDGVAFSGDTRDLRLTRLAETQAVRKLRRVAEHVTPLNLIDSASSIFSPTHCRSLHDITRYVHEKVFETMFYLGDKAALTAEDTHILEGNIPYIVHILDVGGGLAQRDEPKRKVGYSDILSVPMKSFLEGLSDRRIMWDKPRAVSAKGFMSVLGESIAGLPAEVQGVGRVSFAIIADRYMNFSTKAGYHFNTVDTYCGKNINKNYIHFRFEGGAASEVRRARRCQFLNRVLSALDFKAQCRGDVLVARIEKYDSELLRARLVDLGRLTLCSRQLDMLMDSDDSPEIFARSFLAGEMDKF
jgi:pyruvate,water dikinase